MKTAPFRIVAALFCLVMVLSVSACNTMEGFGEDVEAVGGAIEEEASEEQSD